MPALEPHERGGRRSGVVLPGGDVAGRRGPGVDSGRDDASRAGGVRHGRVLFLAPQPFYEDRGTPIAVRLAVEALSELGFAVDLVTFPIGEPVQIPGLNIVRVPNPFGIRNVPIGFSFRKVVLDAGLARKAARLLRDGDYDCVHAVEEAAFVVLGPARRRGVPILYDMQSNLPEGMSTNVVFRTPPLRNAMHAAQRWLLRRVYAVVCSAGLESYVEDAAPGVSVTPWQYPAMPIPADGDAAGRLRASLGLESGRPIVLYAGNFESYQGVGRLVDAIPAVLRSVPEALFLLVGGDEKGTARLPALAGELRERGALRTIERQPRSTIPAFLALADVVVSPRDAVGNLPLKVFDYMAAGKPIVATDNATHRAALDEGNACLVSPAAESMAAGIVSLLTDRERAARLGLQAHLYASAHLGWNDYRERLQTIYRDVMGGVRAE
jgi:glycosyltransferase involved in cell wall biosynthesis